MKPKYYFAKTYFTRWADGEIDTFTCIDLWIKNNGAEKQLDAYKIDKFEFEGWLNFLGYFRRMYW